MTADGTIRRPLAGTAIIEQSVTLRKRAKVKKSQEIAHDPFSFPTGRTAWIQRRSRLPWRPGRRRIPTRPAFGNTARKFSS